MATPVAAVAPDKAGSTDKSPIGWPSERGAATPAPGPACPRAAVAAAERVRAERDPFPRCARSALGRASDGDEDCTSQLNTTRHFVLCRAKTSLRENDLPHGHENGRISACRRSWRRKYSRREYDVLQVGQRKGGPCWGAADGAGAAVAAPADGCGGVGAGGM